MKKGTVFLRFSTSVGNRKKYARMAISYLLYSHTSLPLRARTCAFDPLADPLGGWNKKVQLSGTMSLSQNTKDGKNNKTAVSPKTLGKWILIAYMCSFVLRVYYLTVPIGASRKGC